MKETLLYLWNINHHQMHQLMDSVPDDQWAQQPVGLPNHPAWTIAHLSVASNHLLVPTLKGKPLDLPGWEKRFGYGSQPVAQRAEYPTKEELFRVYDEQHRLVGEGIRSSFDEIVGVETLDENFRSYFPTLDRMVAYMVSIHEANHLGQLADWRRAMGYSLVM
jgi:hypothetical protein